MRLIRRTTRISEKVIRVLTRAAALRMDSVMSFKDEHHGVYFVSGFLRKKLCLCPPSKPFI